MTVETASLGKTLDRDQRKNEIAGRKQKVSRRPDTCMELRAATEDDDDDLNDTPRKCYDQPVRTAPIEYRVLEGGPWTLPCVTIAKLATRMEMVEDAMATEAGIASGLKKMETASTEETEGVVGLSRASTDSRPLFTIVLICLLFAFLYKSIGELSLLSDLTRGFSVLFFSLS